MKIVKVMKGMKKSADRLGAMTSHDVMAPLRAQVIFMLFTTFMTFMSFLETPIENH